MNDPHIIVTAMYRVVEVEITKIKAQKYTPESFRPKVLFSSRYPSTNTSVKIPQSSINSSYRPLKDMVSEFMSEYMIFVSEKSEEPISIQHGKVSPPIKHDGDCYFCNKCEQPTLNVDEMIEHICLHQKIALSWREQIKKELGLPYKIPKQK